MYDYDEDEYITLGEWLRENAVSILVGIIISSPLIIAGVCMIVGLW